MSQAEVEIQFAGEVSRGQRFEFGKNWRKFLALVDDERVEAAEQSLRESLQLESLAGMRFLDVGSGSGLFSLAARRLGATVHSFDYDPDSVACTKEVRRRYTPDDPEWVVQPASVLDVDYLGRLGTFDIVYSWGVLHHTGAMWQALENVAPLVAPRGRLLISIYNDQGRWSRDWTRIKRLYNAAPRPVAMLVLGLVAVYFQVRWALAKAARFVEFRSRRSISNPGPRRGMSRWRDLVDWVGGYPFEVAKPEQIFEFFDQRGFRLQRLYTCAGGHGCNEYVFVREREGADA